VKNESKKGDNEKGSVVGMREVSPRTTPPAVLVKYSAQQRENVSEKHNTKHPTDTIPTATQRVRHRLHVCREKPVL